MIRRRAAWLACVLALCAPRASRAAAAERRHALIIGYNGSPTTADGDAPAPLKFADDDALAFYELERELGDDAVLMTIVDADTRRRFPRIADLALPPSLAGLDRAIAQLRAAIETDARAGDRSTLVFYYSGHGARDKDGQASLTLLGGGLSRSALYERVLDRLPAQTVHIIIDACHAEAVVRMRDADAATVALTPKEVAAFLSQATLARYPQAGLVIASGSDSNAHEWDLFQSGVFTHEVISGLRGGADVNGDGRVEYSELAAFLAAANHEVQDPRARLHSIVRPPDTSAHASLVDLKRAVAAGRLIDIPPTTGRFFVEDLYGARLADGHVEGGFFTSVFLPADRTLFIRSGKREAELVLKSGADQSFAELTFRDRPVRDRGAIDSALHRGLFATPYGPAYYHGYVGQSDIVSVVFTPVDGIEQARAPRLRSGSELRETPPESGAADLPDRAPPASYVAYASAALAVAAFSAAAITGNLASGRPTGTSRPDALQDLQRKEAYATATNGLLIGGAALAALATVKFIW